MAAGSVASLHLIDWPAVAVGALLVLLASFPHLAAF
jgi:hypothetical protein